jgi:hypothetical protein
MPKQIKNIIAFDGGFIDFSDARDIEDKQSSQLLNFSPRYIGRLKMLGSSVAASSDIPDISSGDDISLADNAKVFVYSTDAKWDGSPGGEDYVIIVDSKSTNSGEVYVYPFLQTDWKTNGTTAFWNTDGIPALLGDTSNGEPGFYFVDGNLRISNPNTGVATFAPDGTNGCSSLWMGMIERDYLVATNAQTDGAGASVQATPDKIFCYGAPVLRPTEATFEIFTGISSITNADSTVGPTLDTAGTFGCKVAIERDRGDGTLKMTGRRFYVTYTFDNTQESLPLTLGTVTAADLPVALTSNALGYDVLSTQTTDFGANEIVIARDVRVQSTMDFDGGGIDYPAYKDWLDAGTVTVIDANGQTQTLSYSNIVDHAFEVNTVTVDGSTNAWQVTTDLVHDITTADKVYFQGDATFDFTDAVDVTAANGAAKTLEFTSSHSGSGSVSTTGRIVVYNEAKISGLTGWVDSGYCSVEQTIETIAATVGGSGYTDGTYTLESGGSGPALTFSPAYTGLEGSVTVSSGAITNISITDHGDGCAIGTSITASGNTSVLGSGADETLSVNMSGALITEGRCTDMDGTWVAADLDTGVTVTYDPPGEIDETDENLGFKIILSGMPLNDESIINPIYGGNRITHINFYTNKFEDGAVGAAAETDDMAHVTSFDLVKGWRQNDGSYRAWVAEADPLAKQAMVKSDWFGSMFGDNFQTRTGMFPDTISTDIRWKTATVLNRRVYAGNVIMKINDTDYKDFPDRICKSLPNQFDNFPEYDVLDVTVDDGDEIVHLENFGGKLLQFKKKTLYIIDVTSEPEFLSASFKYRGIPNAAAAKRTDFGVVFANKYGAFIYTGTDVKSLTQAKIESEWATFWSTDGDDKVSVGYVPEYNYAIFKKSGATEFLFHDIATGSWAKGSGNRMIGTTTSDFFDFKGDIYYASKHTSNQVEFYKWSDSPSTALLDNTDNCVYESKEFAFDTPVSDTRLYNVKVTYKTLVGEAPNMAVELVRFDGDTYETVALGDLTGTLNEWQTEEFAIPSAKRVCKTARIKLTQKTSSEPNIGFEVNDFAIVFRSRRIK